MYAPGAKVKMHEPMLLMGARVSVLVEAPTEMTSGAEEGLYAQEFPPLSLPAAPITLMLFFKMRTAKQLRF